MATQQEIEQIAEKLHKTRPAHFLKRADEYQAGIGAVMRFLHESEVTVTAGMIADFMNVSTARVAVLLKKMTAKGLIVRESNPEDARVAIVRLSEYGEWASRVMQEEMFQKIGEAIDRVGMKRMLEFLSVANEIKDIFPQPLSDLELQKHLEETKKCKEE